MLRKGLCLVFAFMLIFALLPAVALAEEAGDDQQEQTETTTEQEGEDPNGEEGEDPNGEEGEDPGASFGFLQKLIERTMVRIQMFGDKLETLPEEARPGIERAMSNFERQVDRFAEMKGWNPGEGKPPWAGNDEAGEGEEGQNTGQENGQGRPPGAGNGEDEEGEDEGNGGPPNGINIGPPDKDKDGWQPGDGKPPWAGGSGGPGAGNGGSGSDNGEEADGNGDDQGDDNDDQGDDNDE